MGSNYKHFCRECGEPIKSARYALGYKLCLLCGDEAAKKIRHTVCNVSKSNYILITDLSLLKGLNKYAQDQTWDAQNTDI